MNNLVSRILLSIFLLPLLFLVFWSVYFFTKWQFGLTDEGALLLTGTAMMAFAIFYWLLLWRRVVNWTEWRVVGTALAVPSSAVLGMLFGIVFAKQTDDELGITFGAFFAQMVWLISTIIIWRETPAERVKRMQMLAGKAVFCPRCGYNLTGLYEARCPECGSKFTLDQLMQAQQGEQLLDVSASEKAIHQP